MPDERRASSINFRGAAEGVRSFSTRPSPFRPFWGHQNGHSDRMRPTRWPNDGIGRQNGSARPKEASGGCFGINFTLLGNTFPTRKNRSHSPAQRPALLQGLQHGLITPVRRKLGVSRAERLPPVGLIESRAALRFRRSCGRPPNMSVSYRDQREPLT